MHLYATNRGFLEVNTSTNRRKEEHVTKKEITREL
jgi:hypothetical protein